LDAFANAKSKMVEIWRWEKGHNIEKVKQSSLVTLEEYFKGITNVKDIQFGDPKTQHMGDKSHGGMATGGRNPSLGAYVSIKSVLWFPFNVTVGK
jgi:hypothetical protein